MKTSSRKKLESWPQPFIRTYALRELIKKEGGAFYSALNRAQKEKVLTRLRRGLYLIGGRVVNNFELAQELLGPSFISLESALSYHGWIPEAVHTTTSVCLKRSTEICTPVGIFSYTPVPINHFFLEVDRMEGETIFLIAKPWRALADLIYCQQRKWGNFREISKDLRIESEEMRNSDLDSLSQLVAHYSSKRVTKVLKKILDSLGKRTWN